VGLTIYSASFDPRNGRCVFGAPVVTTSAALRSRAVFDADLRHFAFTAEHAAGAAATLIVQEVQWGWDDAAGVTPPRHETVGVLGDAAAAAAVREVAGADRAAPVATWRVPGGRSFEAGSERLRIVSREAQPLPGAPRPLRLLRLAPAASVCGALATGLRVAAAAGSAMYETDDGCLRLEREPADPGAAGPGAASAAAGDDLLHVALYARPNERDLPRVAESPPAPIATVRPFARVATRAPVDVGRRADTPPERLALGSAGPYAGWLMIEPDTGATPARWVGLPLSTCALWRLGREMNLGPATVDPLVDDARASVCVAR
jgi:hypothetical protein